MFRAPAFASLYGVTGVQTRAALDGKGGPMRRIIRTTAGTVIIVTLGVGVLGTSAGASGSARVAKGFVAGGLIAAKKAPPNANIATPGPVFNPTSVTGKRVPMKKCKGKHYSFSISNTTSATQQVELTPAQGGGDFGPPIPSGDGLAICSAQKGNFGPVFTLASNSSATLSLRIK
jgi:hypothetical protein